MIQHCPVLIVLLPLTAALLCLLFSKFNKNLGSWLVIGSIAGSLACSLQVLHQTLTSGEAIHYWMGNWEPPLGIEFVIDPLSAVMAVLITFISLMVAVYSKPFMRKEDWLHIGGYYTLYGLLTVGLCGMVITGDMFNLYVYLEVMSLSGYGLIAMGGKKSMLAAFRYMLIGTIGASLYLISVAYLYAMTGTLNMADLGERIMPYLSSPPFALAVACLFIGFGIKMALFPLHGWQPDAYNFAHPGSAAFIAGVMSKVPAYAIIRFFFYIFGVNNPIISTALTVLGILGIGGVLIGSIMALAQYDFRRMLAYSSVAQIGYIAIGLAIGNMYGFIGAVLHIINHAFMKSALFLVIGGIQYRFGEINLYRLGGLNKKMTLSTITVTLAALSMVGIPPTAGFFSKWYLALGALDGMSAPLCYIIPAVLLISARLTAAYLFPPLCRAFFPGQDFPARSRVREPLLLVLSLALFAAASLILGLLSGITVPVMEHITGSIL